MARRPGMMPKKYLKAYEGLYGAQAAMGGVLPPAPKPKRPPRARSCPTEEYEQLLCVAWLRKHAIPCNHSPNGARRSPRLGEKLKNLGMCPGWPDLEIPIPKHPFHGMYCEVKALDGKVSAVQKACIEMLRGNGYYVFVAYGADQFILLASEYLFGDKVVYNPPGG